MYGTHFGLQELPFTITPDTSFFFAHSSRDAGEPAAAEQSGNGAAQAAAGGALRPAGTQYAPRQSLDPPAQAAREFFLPVVAAEPERGRVLYFAPAGGGGLPRAAAVSAQGGQADLPRQQRHTAAGQYPFAQIAHGGFRRGRARAGRAARTHGGDGHRVHARRTVGEGENTKIPDSVGAGGGYPSHPSH